ncbi:hypothetical protein QE422_002018 [Chryseobacterium sp. SORGH_AS 447]|nr:hypothetical protein [Chryseobacterium sp. SORGH_AS_0447]
MLILLNFFCHPVKSDNFTKFQQNELIIKKLFTINKILYDILNL